MMKRRITLACFLGLLLVIATPTFAWVGNAARTSGPDDKEVSKDATVDGVSVEATKPAAKTWDKARSTKNSRDENRPIRGFATTIVVQPPPVVYYPDNGYYLNYPPPYYSPNYGLYSRQPWGYSGPPIIDENSKYDSALVWDDVTGRFQWQPIFPKRPGVVDTPLVNPNFVPSEKVRVRDYGPDQPVQVQHEKAPAASDSDKPTAVAVTTPKVTVPARPKNEQNWTKRGLISSVDRADMVVKIITPEGKYSVDAKDAEVVRNGWKISLATLSEGDAVDITAEISGLDKVRAARIDVLGTKGVQVAEEPMKPTEFRGKIVNIDYPTFTVETESGQLRVLAGDTTRISRPDSERTAFMYLKIGQTVKVVGVGGLTSGYAANEIVVIEPGAAAKLASGT